MCTAMIIQAPQGDIYSSRTMDFSYPPEPELHFVSKSYQWNSITNTHQVRNRYRFMGIGQDISPVVFVNGVSEMGSRAAILYFPGYARYDVPGPEDSSQPAITTLELTGFLLGLSASVGEAAFILHIIRTVDAENPITGTVVPFHRLMADRTGKSMVTEKTVGGLYLMDSPVGVLSNNPDFQWRLTNLRNYMNLSPTQEQSRTQGNLELTPFGQDGGGFSLSGDYASPSRFVRAAFLKTHTPTLAGRDEATLTCFHIMESAGVPKGPVITSRNIPDYTQYTALTNLSSGGYFFETYGSSCITSVSLPGNSDAQTGIRSLVALNQPAGFCQLPASQGAI